MRSSSVAPCESNTHSSTFVACEEKSEKLTPRPSQVAPRGLGSPSLSLYRVIEAGEINLSAARAVAAGATRAVGPVPQRRAPGFDADIAAGRYGRARGAAKIVDA